MVRIEVKVSDQNMFFYDLWLIHVSVLKKLLCYKERETILLKTLQSEEDKTIKMRLICSYFSFVIARCGNHIIIAFILCFFFNSFIIL